MIGTNRAAANLDAPSVLQHRIRALRQDRGRYDVPVDELIEGVCIVDRHQTVIYANRAVCQMLGYNQDELIGRSAADLVEENDRALYLAQFAESERGAIEIACRTKCGRRVQTIVSTRPVFDCNGRSRDSTAVLFDLSERERALRFYRTLVEHLPGAVYQFTMGGGTRAPFNDDNIMRMTGYPALEIQSSEFHPIYSLITPSDQKRVRKAIRRALARMSPFRVEYSIRHRDGRLRHFLDCGEPSADGGDPQQIDGIILDITGQKRLQKKLRRSKLGLQHLSDQLSTIRNVERAAIGQALHDGLGQSLVAAQVRLGTLLEQKTTGHSDPLAADLTELSSILQQSIEELRRISAGLRPAILDDLGLLPALSWLCREFTAIAPDLDLKLDVRLRAGEIPQAIWTSVYRIVQESVSNALKHARATQVVVALTRSGTKIVLEITDNGSGFDPQAITGPEANSDPKHGIGLWSIQRRAALSGGTLCIRSAAGRGTMIRLEWPVDR